MRLDIRPTLAPALTGLKATPGIRAVVLEWNPCVDPSYQLTQIWSGTSSTFSSATLLATVLGNTYTYQANDATTRNYWIRATNIYGRSDGPLTGPITGTGRLITASDLANGAIDLTSAVIVGQLAAGKVSGLGALAILNSVGVAQITGLGQLATVDTVTASQIVGKLDATSQINYLGQLAFANAIAADAIGAGVLAAGVVYAGQLSASNISSGTISTASISVPCPTGTLFSAGYMGTTISYNKMSGYNLDATNSGGGGNPGYAAISGTSYGGSAPGVSGNDGASTGSGYVGYGNYSFYSAGGTAGPFTGSHDGLLPNAHTAVPGDILVDVRCVVRKDISNTLFELALSTAPNQAGVLGVFQVDEGPLSTRRPTALVQQYVPATQVHDDFGDLVLIDQTIYAPEYATLKDDYHLVLANALGEGQINVCGENGTIHAGDFIVASSMPGKGMRQADDMVRGCTVAKARETVTFDDPSQVKTIACIYLAG